MIPDEGKAYRSVRGRALVLAEVLQGLGLVADAASELYGLVADARTASSKARTSEAGDAGVTGHCLAQLIELAFGVLAGGANLAADLAQDSTLDVRFDTLDLCLLGRPYLSGRETRSSLSSWTC